MSGKGPQHLAMTYAAYERYYSPADRAKMDDGDFAGPGKTFPIRTPHDVANAARLIGHAANPEAVKARIIAIANRKGFPLPAVWHTTTTKEASMASSPKKRYAHIKSYWLEDGAISLNGRKYPGAAVDRLIQSAQVQLSDPSALPMTCYLSHEHADRDSTRDLVGKITAVGREGTRAYALIDIPDTAAGRDVATLLDGGYIRSQSLRASGAELRMDHESAFPLVGGSGLKLEGIDFTTTPGLTSVARIAEVVLESHDPQTLDEIFHSSPSSLLYEQDQEENIPMPTLHEDGNLMPMTSGVTSGVDGENPVDAYSQKNYGVPPTADPAIFPTEISDIKAIHDHLASAMNMKCAPSSMESATSKKLLEAIYPFLLTEAGAKFSGKTKMHLQAAHDGVARHLGMECAGSGMADDGMQDSDDDDQPAAKPATKETKKMDPKELARMLQEAGYEVKAPKTDAEKLQEQMLAMQSAMQKQMAEQLAAQQTAFAAQLEETRKTFTAAQPAPQRRSLAEGVTPEPSISEQKTMRKRSYLREKIATVDPTDLIDASCPLPEWLDPERALQEYSMQLLGLMDYMYPMS